MRSDEICLMYSSLYLCYLWFLSSFHGSSAEKKNAVMQAVKEFLSQFGINFDRVKNMVSALIDSYVFFYNIAGLFTHR